VLVLLGEARVRVRRYEPGKGFYYREYRVKVGKYTTVLDALLRIIEEQDSTLAVRYSCKMGICGSCGMVINGAPRLACETTFRSLGTTQVEVEPLYNFPLVRDLVTRFNELLFNNHRRVKPYLIRKDVKEQFNPVAEYRQTPLELAEFLAYSYCIMCGLCVAACPVVYEKPSFIGPQALAQALRWTVDSRDEGEEERLDAVDRGDGVWACKYVGACSKVCPKGVDPAGAIQRLKIMLATRIPRKILKLT
jgi:succinate dehydrogenase / fumarate reductase iron-sulfur subunit